MPAVRYAIATPHEEASRAGEDAFRSGGTAIDAALAAAAVMTVVYPHMCAIGGDAMALVALPDGSVTALVGAGAAPAAADPDAIGGDTMPWQGPHTVTVPGMVDAWGTMAGLGTRLPWHDLLAPAIAFAREGAEIVPGLERAFAQQPAMRFADGLTQPALARTLTAIADRGPRELYEGEIAAALVEGLREAGSPMTEADLARHHTEVTEPIALTVDGVEVLTTPRPTQGYVLHEILAALEDGEEPADAFRRTAAERDRTLADGRSGDTVAIVTADEDGHAVSLIQSLYGAFGAGILEPRTGILLHNRGAGFSLAPGSPNRLAGGRRPAHTLMPVMARRDGALEIVLGAMGGRAQPQIDAQVLLRLLGGTSAAEAVAAQRIVVDGDQIATEGDAVGHAMAIRRLSGGFDAGSDPRADGVAITGVA
jgi:gamma-glutamyltranspeptidase/glutathione hydrolase